MDQPELVTDRLDGERAAASVELGGGDAVYCTPTRVLLYRTEGLLRDESVEEFDLDADGVELEEGRRKATVRLTDREGSREFTVPGSAADEVLEHVLAGVLRAAGTIDSDEAVHELYRFSELTLVVTDARLLKHVGNAVWGPDHESYPFADVTGLSTEEGTHATQLVVAVDGRPTRVKVPAERAGAVRQSVERALLAYRDVDSIDEFEAAADEDGSDDETGEGEGSTTAEEEFEFATATDDAPALDIEEADSSAGGAGEDVAERLAALEAAVERQSELIERQQDLLEQLVEELRRGR